MALLLEPEKITTTSNHNIHSNLDKSHGIVKIETYWKLIFKFMKGGGGVNNNLE